MREHVYDAAVVGGGLFGLCTALFLAREGRRVVLLERAWTGRHASGGTAGGLRTLGRDFAEVPLALEAMEMWRRIESLAGDSCGFRAHGQVKVAESAEQWKKLEDRVARLGQMGYDHEKLIDACELRGWIPAIAPHCVGAAAVRSDGSADPQRTILAFRRAAKAAGVTLFEGAGVRGIERRAGRWMLDATELNVEAEWVVNAAGAWAGGIARMIGDDIPLGSKASMMIVTERVEMELGPVVSSAGRGLSFKRMEQGTLVIGGGVQGRCDVEAERSEVDFSALTRSAQAVTELFPCVGPVHITRCWTGIEGKTRDLLPVIDYSPSAENAVHVCGFSGHGLLLVPAVGKAVADMIVCGQKSAALAPFSASRLMGGADPGSM
jgi:sarcosine oxidase, subunit beta